MRVHSCIYNITANQIKESWNPASFWKCDFANVKMTPPSSVSMVLWSTTFVLVANTRGRRTCLSQLKCQFMLYCLSLNNICTYGEAHMSIKCPEMGSDYWNQKKCIWGIHTRQKLTSVTNIHLKGINQMFWIRKGSSENWSTKIYHNAHIINQIIIK